MSELKRLREEMKKFNIDVYLIVSNDFHLSEYVGDYFKCREYISGFGGSAGTLVITMTEAGLWTDGRYFIQAEIELAGSGIALYKMGEENVPTVMQYLEKTLRNGQCLGYDGRTLSVQFGKKMKESLDKQKVCYIEDVDLVGNIWDNRPDMSCEPVWILDDCYAGETRGEKLARLRKKMKEKKADYHLISSLDDIAWLYNIRGNDIEYNPVPLAYSLVDAYGENTILYIQENAVSDDVKKLLNEDDVIIKPYLQIYEDIKDLGKDEFCLESNCEKTIMIDETKINLSLYSKIPKGIKILCESNPTTIYKAVKNQVEMKNVKLAHIKDGVAVTKLIYWLKQLVDNNRMKEEEITELTVSHKLYELRKKQDGFLEQSFSPIVATGVHGAIVHYEPTDHTNIRIEQDNFILIDTGGHYYEGTTDVTRTIAMGMLTRQQKEHYTAVLRGNLNLAAAHFKKGVTGENLDYLAREPLWELGLDYNHGTGHGVGYLLNVHEGPNAIRLKNADGMRGTPFEEGMVTSDEPGLYLENQYGIRLENLILCVKDKKTDMGQFMKFEPLTMIPFDRDAILPECMSREEINLLNQYHKKVYETIAEYLTDEEREWLLYETSPVLGQ